ncbi:MAG: hypothetical protein JNM66_13805 [Bryobacterales bacterium]|nr:hypothetical protein [Bryobacterales bacterium]
MTLKIRLITLALAAVGIGGTFAWAQHSHEHGDAKAVQITGQVVDIACFVGHNSSGEKHAKCAESCARAGNPLAIFDGKEIYVSISMDHGNPNTKLMPFIEKKVKVTGAVLEKGGLKGIKIEKVEIAQ